MHAEAADRRRRIDQRRKGRPAVELEIDAARVPLARAIRDHAVQGGRSVPGGVHHFLRLQRHWRLAADRYLIAACDRHDPLHRRVQRQHGAPLLRRAEVGEHQAVTVDDAGFRRPERGEAGQIRLPRPRLRRADARHAFDAIHHSFGEDAVQPLHLSLRVGDDELAAFPCGDPMRGAPVIETPAPLHAHPRLQAAFRVIDPGMDHFGIAGRGFRPERPRRLKDHHLATRRRQRPRDGQSDHPGADHHCLNFIHGADDRRLPALAPDARRA